MRLRSAALETYAVSVDGREKRLAEVETTAVLDRAYVLSATRRLTLFAGGGVRPGATLGSQLCEKPRLDVFRAQADIPRLFERSLCTAGPKRGSEDERGERLHRRSLTSSPDTTRPA